jgi:hypothetical protein
MYQGKVEAQTAIQRLPNFFFIPADHQNVAKHFVGHQTEEKNQKQCTHDQCASLSGPPEILRGPPSGNSCSNQSSIRNDNYHKSFLVQIRRCVDRILKRLHESPVLLLQALVLIQQSPHISVLHIFVPSQTLAQNLHLELFHLRQYNVNLKMLASHLA